MAQTLLMSQPVELTKHTSNGTYGHAVQTSIAIEPPQVPSPPRTITELIRSRATELETKDEPVVLYPSKGEYLGYSPACLDTYASNAASHYSSLIPRRRSSDEPVRVIALLGPSTLEYFISMLALTRLGHTVLFLSTRISEEAHVSLLKGTKASTLLVDEAFVGMGEKVAKQTPNLQVARIVQLSDYEDLEHQVVVGQDAQHLDPTVETNNVAWIIHSSGSTSLPKPVFITHSAALKNYVSQFSLVGFITLPLYHAHGMCCVFRGIVLRKKIYMYDATLPLTSGNLLRTLQEHPEIKVFYGVPYALKLLSESEEGTRALARLDVVLFGGSACPKPIGDQLVRAGVLVAGHYGSTETGQLMTSFRTRDDPDWDFMRPSDAVRPYLRFEPYTEGIYEIVVLDGWPSKVATNREDGSYATKDLFEKHPTKDAWRYYARKDDTIVLVNGEKTNPLLLEGVAKQSSMVAEAVVFGAQRPQVGLFVIPAEEDRTTEEVADAIWPAIKEANKVVPAYARLSKDMIRLLPANAEYRKTDKSTVVRAAFYKTFAEQIDAVYEEALPRGSLVLDENELHVYLHKILGKSLPTDHVEMLKDDTDLFSLGIDSLQASQIRGKISRDIDTGDAKLGLNFVFDFPSIDSMAQELFRMRDGGLSTVKAPVEERMRTLIAKYSHFAQHSPTEKKASGNTVLITGATGSLGAHLVAQVAELQDVTSVVVLVRARTDQEALSRVLESLKERRISDGDSLVHNKVTAYASNFADEQLGLDQDTYTSITATLTSVIHCAWSVNFNLGLESFERDCIAGTRHLIDLCLRSEGPQPASFNFCSSVSAVAGTPAPQAPEELPLSLSYAQGMGYAQSKLVTEHICLNAAKQTAIEARVLRTGQIIGDTRHGVWNAQEAIPMIFQSATTVGALPKLDELPSWLPVDTVATALMELSVGQTVQSGVYHVVNNRTFHWTRDLLPQLKASGLKFEEVEQREWLRRLGEIADPVANPPYKLAEFFTSKYDRDTPRQGVIYSSNKARASSRALNNAPLLSQTMVDRFVGYLSSIW